MFSICWFDRNWLYGCIKSFCSNLSKSSWVRRSQAAKYCWRMNLLGLATKVVRLTTTKRIFGVSYTLAILALQFVRFELVPVCFYRMYESIILSLTLTESSHCIHSWTASWADLSFACNNPWCLFCSTEKMTPLQTKQHFKFLKGSKNPSSLQTVLVMCSLVNLFHGIYDHWILLDHSTDCFCSYHPLSGTEGLDATFWPLTLHQFLIEEVCALRRVVYQVGTRLLFNGFADSLWTKRDCI